MNSTSPTPPKIVNAFLSVGVFAIFAKLAGAAKELMVAHHYGVSKEVDAYYFLFNIFNWPIGVWFSVLTSVLVPLLISSEREAPNNIRLFKQEFTGLTILLSIGMMLIGMFALPMMLTSSWVGLDEPTIILTNKIYLILSWMMPLGVMVGLYSAWLMALGSHNNTLFEAIPSIIIGVFLFLPDEYITQPLIWGTVVGFSLHLFAFIFPLYKKNNLFFPCFTFKSNFWPVFWKSITFVVIGQALMSFVIVVDQVFAARIGDGAISIMNYANRLIFLIQGMSAIVITRATMHIFSKGLSEDREQAKKRLLSLFSILGPLSVLGTLIFWVLAPQIVDLLFQHGSFGEDDAINTVSALRYGLLQIPFYVVASLLITYIAANRHYILFMKLGALALCVKLVFSYVLTERFELNGLMASSAIMYAINALIMLKVYLKK
jgi:peptidoglycan biosynthesis protein MviN/MurJ (putative lipid II flippase)